MIKSEGLEVKEERGNRIFPVTDNAQSVIDALYSKLKKLNVKIITNAKVTDIITEENKVTGVIYIEKAQEKEMLANKVILATGGASYKATGSTGDGYKIAKKCRT